MIADQKELQAVSMRAAAQRIGLTAMALYSRFTSKDALLDGHAGQVLAELPTAGPAVSWQQRLVDIAHAMRDLAQRHPAIVPLLFSRPAVTPDAIRAVDALLDVGVTADQVERTERC